MENVPEKEYAHVMVAIKVMNVLKKWTVHKIVLIQHKVYVSKMGYASVQNFMKEMYIFNIKKGMLR